MSSNINTTVLNKDYPVARTNNDSQGFRTNFDAIKTNLNVAKTEITALQETVAQLTDLVNSLTTVVAGIPHVPTSLLELGIADGLNGYVLSANGNGTFTFKHIDTGPSQISWSTITGKPTTLAGYGITDDVALATHTHSWSTISNTPTTVAGYGITDAVRVDTTNVFTAPQRGIVTQVSHNTANNSSDVIFDLSVSNNFYCTITMPCTLWFNNIQPGQSGSILVNNTNGNTISVDNVVMKTDAFLTTISSPGYFYVSYYTVDTGFVYVTCSAPIPAQGF